MNAPSVVVEAGNGDYAAAHPGAASRLAYLERAKGLAIFLVVLGHLSREAPPGHDWYMALKDGLYQFHMPFFMCLSGMTMYLSYRAVRGMAAYGDYVRGKFLRLMPAFLLFGLLILVGKEVASRFMPVDNLHADIASGAWLILTKPITSSAGFLWYVYTLFLFYTVMPLMMRFGTRNLAWLLPLAVALHAWPMDKSVADWFMFSQFSEYLLYLVIGFFIARDQERCLLVFRQYGAWFMGIFLLLLAAFQAFGADSPLTTKTALGIASIPALLALVNMRWAEHGGWLATLGAYCFTIYLLNLPFIGTLKGLAAITPAWDGGWFPLLGLCMLASGLLLPILVSRFYLQRVRWLDRITR